MKKINIKEILSQYRLVVPEIQRDYVWGKNLEVLAQFIGDLYKKLASGSDAKANIGFLYSYPRGNEDYVIDGQQRLNTILLLLHFLSAKNPELYKDFKNRILPDSTVPVFAYRVRPTSLSFMKMLFKSTATDSASIKALKDYKLCYDEDRTVESCLETLDWFSKNLVNYPHLNYDAILKNVEFWYFSVDQTSQGEELYITMNSRGERLTESEHIKPRLFNKLGDATAKQAYGKKWDDWEEFFYSHRKDRNISSVDTAMNNIIRIVVELKTGKILNRGLRAKDADDITLDEITTFMSALSDMQEMVENDAEGTRYSFVSSEISRLYDDDSDKPQFADGDFNVLKTLLSEYLRPTAASLHTLEQVYHLMRNLMVRGILKSSKDLLSLLLKMRDTTTPFYDYMLVCSEDDLWHDVITGNQEPRKIRIFQKYGAASELQIWAAQETNLWKGDIKPLLEWATIDGKYSIVEFDRMHGLLKEFINENKNEGLVDNDYTRRALLTFHMSAYPWLQDGRAYFGHTASEWRQIIIMDTERFREFLTSYEKSGLNPDEFCWSRIENFPTEHDWSEFVKFPYLLEYLNTKHVTYSENRGWFLEKDCYAKQISVNDEHLYRILKEKVPQMLESNYRVGKTHSGNDNWVLVTDDIVKMEIWYEQNLKKHQDKQFPVDQCYVVRIHKHSCKTPEERKTALQRFVDEFEFISAAKYPSLRFTWDDNSGYYMLRIPFPNQNDFKGASATILKLLEEIFTSPSSRNNWSD